MVLTWSLPCWWRLTRATQSMPFPPPPPLMGARHARYLYLLNQVFLTSVLPFLQPPSTLPPTQPHKHTHAGASYAERTSAVAVANTDALTRAEALAVLATRVGARDTICRDVYQYWLAKRKKWGKPLLRRLQAPTPANDSNPHRVFRWGQGGLGGGGGGEERGWLGREREDVWPGKRGAWKGRVW
jgi:hypothetical protein